MVQQAGLSSRYPYSPAGVPLGAVRRKERRADRTGSQTPDPGRKMEGRAPADDLFRPHLLSRPWPCLEEMPDLFEVYEKDAQEISVSVSVKKLGVFRSYS